MFSGTLQRIEDGVKVYQYQELQQFPVAHIYYTNHYKEYCQNITGCIKSRPDLEMMCDIEYSQMGKISGRE